MGIDENESLEHLKAIVQKWITIRGHSLGRKYMEDYRRAKHTGVKAKKGLRRQLELDV